jgi:hypothetical protein
MTDARYVEERPDKRDSLTIRGYRNVWSYRITTAIKSPPVAQHIPFCCSVSCEVIWAGRHAFVLRCEFESWEAIRIISCSLADMAATEAAFLASFDVSTSLLSGVWCLLSALCSRCGLPHHL